MADHDDFDPGDSADDDLEHDGRPHAPGHRRIDAQERLAEGWSPAPIAAGPDGGPVPIPQTKLHVLQDEDWICLRGPCRHYHRMTTSFDAQRPMPQRGPDGELVSPDAGHEPRATIHTCYPSPGVEFSMGELVVYDCNLWDPIVRSHQDDFAREMRRMEYAGQHQVDPAPSMSLQFDLENDDGDRPFDGVVPDEIMDGGVLGRHAAYISKQAPLTMPTTVEEDLYGHSKVAVFSEADFLEEAEIEKEMAEEDALNAAARAPRTEWYGHFTNPRTGQDWWVVARDINHAHDMMSAELGPEGRASMTEILLESVAEPCSVRFKIHRGNERPFTAILSDVASGHIVTPGPKRTLSLPCVLPPTVELEKQGIPPAFDFEQQRAYFKVESVDGETTWYVVARDRAHAINVVERDPLLERERQVMWWRLSDKEAEDVWLDGAQSYLHAAQAFVRKDRDMNGRTRLNLTDIAVGRYITGGQT